MKKSDLHIAFLGTPDFAVPSLAMLLEEGYDVCAVFTQPDRPKGRGHKLAPPPVKVLAMEHGIPVYQHERISRTGVEDLKNSGCNLMITAAYGQILSEEVLAIPEHGCINVHASLLPKLRGAAPIEWSIINGDEKTGITTMYTVYALDAGDIIEQDEVEILPEETCAELRERLSRVGGGTLKRTLEKLVVGTLKRTPQVEEESTMCRMFPRGFGVVDFNASSKDILNLIRALAPAPAAYAFSGDMKIKLVKARAAEAEIAGEPGTVMADAKKGLFVKTADGAVEIVRLKAPGGKEMDARDYLRGGRTIEKFTASEETL